MRSTNLIELAFFLKKSLLFGSLDLDILLTIAEKMQIHHFRPMDVIFNCDQEGFRLYLILLGRVVIMGREKEELAELNTGDFFGDESLFNEKERGYGAHCKTKVELLSLSRPHLLSIINEFPSVALALLDSYSRHISFRQR